MDRGFAVLIMAIVGGCIALQAPINAGLGKHDRQLRGGDDLFRRRDVAPRRHRRGQREGRRPLRRRPCEWYLLLGGALGAAYVFSALVLVSQIGAGAVAAATVTGQLTTSVILDRIGFLGLEQTSFSASRVAGVALLLAGTYLVVR